MCSRIEGDNKDPISSNRINNDDCKNEIGSFSNVYSENYNVWSSMHSENNNLELKDSRMSRTNLDSNVNMVVVGQNCEKNRETYWGSTIHTKLL